MEYEYIKSSVSLNWTDDFKDMVIQFSWKQYRNDLPFSSGMFLDFFI